MMIYLMIFIAWFDWKIGVFQQTAVSVYYIFKVLRSLKERCMVLKPGKWQGIVVLNKKD